MPIMNIKVASTKFLSELWQRHYSFGPTVAYRITVPESLWFWYVLEFGSAGRQDSSAPYKSQWGPGQKYPIDPINGKALHWKDDSGDHFAFHVNHPGIRPRLVYRGVRDEIIEHAGMSIGAYLVSEGMRLSSIQTAMTDEAMPFAVELIAEAFDTATPEVKGSVATAWSSGAKIVQTQ
jgi:hypothetical protein